MLKMKIDPAMCMKTQARRQNVTTKTRHFARNCTSRGIIDKNRAGLLPESAKFARESERSP
jgi:intergrase/recombinase